MRKRNVVKFLVIRFGSKQLWRLTLIVFLVSLSVSTLWQLMTPRHTEALDFGGIWNATPQSSKVQWHWAELLVQGFPWLRGSSPTVFLSPLQNVKRLVGTCIGFVPGDALQTVAFALPWMQEAKSQITLHNSALYTQAPHQQTESSSGETSPVASEHVATPSAVPLAQHYSLLPSFGPNTAVLQGDLAPQMDYALSGDVLPAETEAMLGESDDDRAPILIFHTHNAEAYQASGDSRYVYNNDSRTVVHIGEILALKLQEMGVAVVHDTTHHMDANFNLAYVQARRTLQRQMNQSEFSMILDLHNDGTAQEITTCEIDGQSLARMLLVIGKADGIGTSWRQNEAFASAIHQGLQEIAPGLSRGLYYEPGVRYNQDVHPAALIVEVGGNENSLEEALRSVDFLALILADLYFNGW